MKLIRRLLIVVLVLVVFAVGALIVSFVFVDSAAKAAIERGGSYALGVPTTVQSTDVGLLSGRFELAGLHVGNPPGFTAPHFLTLGTGDVAVSLNTLTNDVVTLPHLRLDAVDVRLEKKDGKTNYKVILDNVEKVTGPAPTQPPPDSGKRFIVNDLAIRNVEVHVDMLGGPGAIGDLTKVTVPIDEIKLVGVGKTGKGVAGTGVTMSELVSIIVQAVLAAAAEKGGDIIPADLLNDLKGQLASLEGLEEFGMQIVGDAQGAIKDIGKEAEKAADEAKKAVEDATKGIKDLLPGRKNN